MYAAEIMTKEVVTVRPNATVGEIADLLLDHTDQRGAGNR
jgi:CBS domain-containing protein